MASRKSKGGVEKAGIKKRKALETDAANYAKIFTLTSFVTWFVTSNEDETGKAICLTLPAKHRSC